MKKLWKENRVLFMLFIILIICFIAIISVAMTFFYAKDVSIYGSRLDNIDKHKITKKVKSGYIDSFSENELVKKVTFETKGRIIYVHLNFNEDTELEKAKEIATASLELLDEKISSYYDIEFVLKSDNFIIMGAKNAVTDHVSWNNNREIVEEEEPTDEKS